VSEDTLRLTQIPEARAAMLIRRPVAEVFAAFVDPAVTSKFWFTRGSGPLEPGTIVTWHWDMYGFSTQARTIETEPGRRLLVEWIAGDSSTRIEWRFFPRADDTTFVSITNSGFTGSGDEVAQHAIASTEGFTFVLAGAKAWLEHGIALNLVPDRFPDGLEHPPDAD
jgi:uncharacterized protein YndB with AHSA1/START domain